jgi:DNA repair exonuclease SbcCD ATPase subunit
MPTTDALPVTTRQLAALGDQIQQAKQQRADQERATRGRHQARRRAESRLSRTESDLATVERELNDKRSTVATLNERLDVAERKNQTAPGVGDERAALVEAITLATEQGAPVVAGHSCPSNARPFRLLFDLAPHGTNWHVPIVELERVRGELTSERDRLRAELERLSATAA